MIAYLEFLAPPLLQIGFEALVTASLIAGAMAIIALLVQRLIGGRVSVRVVGLLWMLVLVRFLLLAAPESPTSFLNLMPRAESAAVGEMAIELGQIETSRIDELAAIRAIDIVPGSTESSSALEGIGSRSHLSPVFVAGLVWMVGVIWLTLILCVRFFRVQQMFARSTIANNKVQIQFENCKRRVGVKRTVRLFITRDLETPAMTGVFKPTVLLPEWVMNELTDDQLDLVLVHELVHVRKWDGCVLLTSYFIKMLHWFNPLVHMVIGRIDACRELACDQQVIKLMGGDEESARRYGQTILLVAERIGEKRTRLRAIGLGLVGGFIGSDDKLVKQRIAMLMNTDRPRRLVTAFCIVGMSVLVAVGFTEAQTGERSNNSPVEDTTTSSEQGQVVLATVESEQVVSEQESAANGNAKTKLSGWETSEIDFDDTVPYEVELGSALKMNFDFRIPELMVVAPDSIRVGALAPTLIEVKGLKVGVTSFIVIAEDGEQHQVTVCVTHPLIDPMDPEHLAENSRLRLLAKEALKVLVGDIASEDGKTYSMTVGTSRRHKCDFRIPEMMVETSEVVTLTPVSPTEFLVTATKAGSTSVTIRGEHGEVKEFRIVAIPDVRKLNRALSLHFPGMEIDVKAISENIVELSGIVPDEEQVENVIAVAKDFFPNVVSQLKIVKARGSAVAFQVKVYEVDTKRLQALGVDWKAVGSRGDDIACFADLLNAIDPGEKPKPKHAMMKTIRKDNQLMKFLDRLEQDAVVKLTDQPVLVVELGRLAELVIGREVPVTRDGQVDFVNIGVKLNVAPRLAPTENDKQRMVVEMQAEYSELAENKEGKEGKEAKLPQFLVRRVNSGVVVSPGESIALVLEARSGLDGKEKEIVFLATPKMIKAARVRANPAFNAKRSDADLMFDSPNGAVRR